MIRLIGEHWEGDVRVRCYEDDVTNELIYDRSQDAQPAAELVSTINAEGVPTHDGLGKPVAELPQIVWMDYCAQRGLDWTKLFSGNDLDAEFKRCAAEHSRFKFDNTKSVHTVQ